MTYKTAYRWWKAGKLDTYQMDTGKAIVRDPLEVSATTVALYARVSSVDQKNDLECQLERMKDYAAAHGFQVTCIVCEIGSRLHDRRPKFLKLLTDPTIGVIVVKYRDRGTRFGYIYIEQDLEMQGRRPEVVIPKDTDDDLVNDGRRALSRVWRRAFTADARQSKLNNAWSKS